MRKRRLQIEDLRACLSYDSEVKKFLSFNERCIIHSNQIKIISFLYPLDFSPELKEKIKDKLSEIRKKRWKRPEFRFEKEYDTVTKVKVG